MTIEERGVCPRHQDREDALREWKVEHQRNHDNERNLLCGKLDELRANQSKMWEWMEGTRKDFDKKANDLTKHVYYVLGGAVGIGTIVTLIAMMLGGHK